jgi:PAS domain S-box-containing protein
MQAVLDAAPVLVYMKDLDGRYLFVNRRFEETFERDREQVAGHTDYDLFPTAQAETYREADRRVMTAREPLEVEEVAYQGLREENVHVREVSVFDSDGSPYALCGISADITDRKTAEEALQRYNSELEQFAFVAAHDLQEPLRTVKTYAQLLNRRYKEPLDGEGAEFINYIVAGTDRMSLLVSDLRTYTEVATRSSPQRTACDLNVILGEVRMDLNASILETGAALVVDGPLPVVQANGRQMSQLFQNLISNAIKYRREQPPRVDISTTFEGREWTFRIRDNGIGLDMRYANQIFGVFKRLHGRDVPGTGIGLAICKQIVEHHGGRIWVESALGAGSTFVFTLPA